MQSFLKKRTGRGTDKHPTDSDIGNDLASAQTDRNFALVQFRKTFFDFTRNQLSSPEFENRLYRIIPMFCKIAASTDQPQRLHAELKESYQFANHVSRLFVQEVKKRASNQNTETAAVTIAEFLEPDAVDPNASNGWLILRTLDILVSFDASDVIEAICHAAVPSTLAKCLYLFYDLPSIETTDGGDINAVKQLEKVEHGSSLNADYRRTMLHHSFVELFTRVCRYGTAVEEMARRDDLALLCGALTSWCPSHNLIWRRATMQILCTVSLSSLTPAVINYFHAKGFLGMVLDNLVKSADISLPEKVEIADCLFTMLKNSCNSTTAFVDEMRSMKGYSVFVEFILQYGHEESISQEDLDALKTLVHIIGSAVYVGYVDLKPSSLSDALYQLPGFSVPVPLIQGTTAKNIPAFQVLQMSFISCSNSAICSVVLDVVSSIYCSDPANYFILESECPFGKFAEVVHAKSKEVQVKFFEVLEFIVFHLNHVPCREFIALGVMLRMSSSTECRQLCVQSLRKTANYNALFKDVLREVGLLEVFVSLLDDYYNLLKPVLENEMPNETAVTDVQQHNLAICVMDMLALLLKQNNSNASVFRECGGTRLVFALIPFEPCRMHVLPIVQQLLLLPGGDDDIAALLGAMHASKPTNLSIKFQILRALLFVLRESHKVRLAFRKVGGFLYVMSTLVTFEGALSDIAQPPWSEVNIIELLDLLKLVFKVLTVAMRFEPSNARFFSTEVGFDSLTESLQLLGCFSPTVSSLVLRDVPEQFAELARPYFDVFFEIFKGNFSASSVNVPPVLLNACFIAHLLHGLALDQYERPSPARKSTGPPSSTPVLNHVERCPVPTEGQIVYPSAVLCIVSLLPSLTSNDLLGLLSLQVYLAEVVKSLCRTERNQQVMCDAGLPQLLFEKCGSVVIRDGHPLQSPVLYMLERLAAQSMRSKELRQFLRLDMPLCCRDLDDESERDTSAMSAGEGRALPLTRVKTLVSMMTPRDFRVAGMLANPPFVEFDMSVEGFGCIYLPSIAPQTPGGSSFIGSRNSMVVATAADTLSQSIGGLGTGERVFPPMNGFTYSTWICVEKFSECRTDSHPIRLLTVVRSMAQNVKLTEDPSQLGCLSIQISPIDRALLVATNETDTPGADLDRDAGSGDACVRLNISELQEEQRWNHLVIVLSRAMLKNSTILVYVNGVHHTTQKIRYIVQNPGGGAPTLNTAACVNAFVGTPPGPFRRQSQLVWRLGSTYALEECWTQQQVRSAFRLGPHYTGCFQRPICPPGERLPSLISEERITFGISAHAVSQLTLSKLRKIYNKIDSKMIAKQLGISSHENVTPIWLLHNLASHLTGPSRCFGGVLIGYLGLRTFKPRPVSRLLESVGGVSALLGLVAMSVNAEGLYASIKALLCAVRANRAIELEMNRIRGYQILGVLLKEKHMLMNSHIMHLLFSLVGTLDSTRETTCIPNIQAFEDLLCDLEIWKSVNPELHRLLFEHMYELITESGDSKRNLYTIRQVGVISRLLFVLDADSHILRVSKDIIFSLLAAILQPMPDTSSLLKFGQYVATTVPCGDGESEVNLPKTSREVMELALAETNTNVLARKVYTRNRCLSVLLNIMQHVGGNMNYQFAELIATVLGFDWLMQFFGPQVHCTSVGLALRLLLSLLSHAPLLQKFQEGSGTHSSGWLAGSDSVVQNRAAILLGFSVSAHGGSVGAACDINRDVANAPGFSVLLSLLPYHAHLPDVFIGLLSLAVGQPAKSMPETPQFDMDSVWSLVFDIPRNHSVAIAISKVELCRDAILVLLAVARRSMLVFGKDDPRSLYPVELFNFLTFLYHNLTEFTTFCMNEEFLAALLSCCFPSDSGHSNELSEHPAQKQIMDFTRNIIIDSLSASLQKGDTVVVDILLEQLPCGAGEAELNKLFTSLLQATMEHLLASDVLLYGVSSSLPLMNQSGSNYSTVAANVFYFCGRLVDCLWSSVYKGSAHEVWDFLMKLISQAKRKASGLPLDSLYRCVNRCTLFLLSRGADSLQVLESLNKLVSNRSLMFGSANTDAEFFACLAHLLFISTLPEPPSEENTNFQQELAIKEASVLMQHSACRVWEELYLNKKQLIEDAFHTSLISEINAARSLAGDVVNRVWQNYLDMELRGPTNSARDLGQIHAQLQSKIQKVAGGLQRLASRKTLPLRPSFNSSSNRQISTNNQASVETLELWMRVHVSLVKELFRLHHTQYLQWHEHVQRYCLTEWRTVEGELTRERGLWGPNHGSKLDHWSLDNTEGPCRMRKKQLRNDLFYINYPYRPNLELAENRNLKYKVATSRDSRQYYERMKAQRPTLMDPRIVDLSKTVATPAEDSISANSLDVEINPILIRRSSTRRSDADTRSIQSQDDESKAEMEEMQNADAAEENESVEPVTLDADNRKSGDDASEGQAQVIRPMSSKMPDNQTLLRLLEEGEELQSMFRCARVNGLDTSEGLLLFGKQHYYVVDGYTLLKTREIRDLDFLSPDMHDPIVPYCPAGNSPVRGQPRQCNKFAYEDVREVLPRRYLLQPIALEVFSADGRNYLLAFPRKTRNKVYTKFLAVARGLTDSEQSVSGQRNTANVESTGNLLSNLMGETSVTQRWVRGELSNFQYLMHLNTLAGRSYNDLMQYPVFPWVLQDYESEELDLTDPASFRDFSKPMGALTQDRLQQFMKRYREWDDPTGETPPYMYGTHYSSAMIVVAYLVRLEPFTQQFLTLQGGHFDLADRMFHSIRDSWWSASKNNMADVKELIPEFFYLPDFLTNANNFDFGAKQSGVQLGDVVLPGWAKGDPREFIRVHREALECDYVSAHLHEWIDLIFGYKQTGPAAVDACNVFHHLFYEGNVDFEAIEDPLTRNATIGFINNFGQIPTQLFKKPHPGKRLKSPDSWSSVPGVSSERLFFHSLDCLKPPLQPVKQLKGVVGQIVQTDKGILCCVEQNKALVPPNFTKYIAWGFADNTIRLGSAESEKMSSCVFELSDSGDVVCAVCPNNRTLVTGGTNTVVTVWEIFVVGARGSGVTLRVRKDLYGHTESVSALAASGAFGIVVSGSQDRTCIVWDLSRLAFIRQLSLHPATVSAVAINDTTGDIATCAGTHVYLWDINGQLLCAVNSSTSPKLDMKQCILTVAFSQLNEWDSQNVLMTGSSDGVLRFWTLEYTQLPETLAPNSSSAPDMLSFDPDHETTSQMSKMRHREYLHSLRHLTPETLHLRVLEKQRAFESQSSSSTGTPDVMSPAFFPPMSESDSGTSTPYSGRSKSLSRDETSESGVEVRGLTRDDSTDTDSVFAKEFVSKGRLLGQLKPGFRWQRQLVFRSKLTMHTATERRDNPTPAAVTAIASSRDHKTLYVGDSRGRVWAWVVGEAAGRADHWVQDLARSSCTSCQQKFTFSDRRHHCRNCGQIFCAKCSRYESEIKQIKVTKPVRVCQNCYYQLKNPDAVT